MTEELQQKSVAYVKWDDKDGKGSGVNYGVEAKGIDIFLAVVPVERHDLKFSHIKAPLHPGDGPGSAQLIIVCPRCAQQLRIATPHKSFEWEPVFPPHPINVPGNPDAIVTALLSIVEPLQCPSCSLKFEVKENQIRVQR